MVPVGTSPTNVCSAAEAAGALAKTAATAASGISFRAGLINSPPHDSGT